MNRLYADLHLRPNLEDSEKVARMMKKASKLGYHLIAISLPSNIPSEKIQQLQDSCKEFNMEFASRVDLKPQTPKELINSLRKLRRKFEIIAVLCESKPVARQAAKDHRVDILNFPSTSYRGRFFDKAEAELASKSQVSLEIDAKLLLTREGPTRIRLLSSLRRETTIAQAAQVPLILSSGVSNELLLRKPQELAAFASLFDLEKNSATEAVSRNPITIIERNRKKLGPNFVAPGIFIVRRGRDC